MLLLTCACGEGLSSDGGSGGATGVRDDAAGPCTTGLTDCGSLCVDLEGNGDHCGGCGLPCSPGTVCSEGACGGECTAPGQVACGTSCVDPSTNALHCGMCGLACAPAESCVNGACAATPGAGGAATGGSSGGGTGGATTGGDTGSGGAGDGDGVLVDGVCRPVCASSASDPDSDGWGWENDASCVVAGSTPYQGQPSCDIGSGGSGGTGGTGGAGGSGGSGGTGGSGGSSCGVAPANSNSSSATRKVLCYLHEIYGESVLSGQQDCHWSASSDLEYVQDRTGVYPAVVGGDFLYTNAVSQAVSSWNAGGLSMIRYHMGRPEDADSYESSLGTTDLANTLTPGTARYNGLMSKLNHAAAELEELQDAGVVVLWAPFHEAQPGGWFWWSKGTGEQYKQLWRLMFDNFKARGLNNLIWLMPFSGSPNSSFFPGAAYVDIAGPDTYATSGQPFANMYQSTVGVVGSTMPIPLHETGRIPSPASMFQNNQAPWVLFSTWCDTWLRDNSDSTIQTAYSHARTVNRGELPNFD